MSDRWLVTGAAGFIGSHLCDALLRDGVPVAGIDIFDQTLYADEDRRRWATAASSGGLQFGEIDIRDKEGVHRCAADFQPTHIVHLAALAGVRPSIASPEEYASVNIDGLVSVLDAAASVGCRRFVFASSSSVYGNTCSRPFVEDAEHTLPISPYGATKRSGEFICRIRSEQDGMPIATVRPFTVFGERQRPDLAIHQFMRKVASGETISMFGDGSSTRDYTYVGDIVQGIRLASDAIGSEPRCREWNLGHGEPIELRELIAMIGEVVGRSPVIEELPMQTGDVDHTAADLQRSIRELGYAPSTTFADGLRRQWDWMQGQAVSC